MDCFDVVIVGAGPGGATLAYLLARSGQRVALVERERRLDREFRGPGYQPAVVKLWKEMGVADLILELDHASFENFEFGAGKGMKLPGAVVLMHQGPLLRRLIQLAGQYPHFSYFGGIEVDTLTAQGVKAGDWECRADLVVAADGRFSRLRSLAGIELEKAKQRFDVLWFEMPQVGDPDAGFRLSKRGLLVHLPQEGNRMQVGWILQKGKYPALQKRGFDAFKAEVEELLETKIPIKGWEDCSLLDVKIAMARQWQKENLLLIGDAAHIASPVGAIGNKLAIEDAVLAHRLILEGRVGEFERLRRPDIAKQLRMQRGMAWVLFHVPWIIPYIANPKPLALSPHPLHVATEHFREGKNYRLLKVKEVVEETASARSIVFEGEMPFKPGQFLTLRVLREGQLLKRCYSLSSASRLQVTVKRQEGGKVSPHLCDELKVGDRVLALPPAGQFVARGEGHYAFVAAGSGITPIMGLIEQLRGSRLRLFYVNRSRDEIIFANQLEGVEVTHWITGEQGRPSAADLAAFFEPGGWPYVCGPAGLRKLVCQVGEKVREEVFLSAVSDVEAPMPYPKRAGEVPEKVIVELDGETTEVPIGPDQTILDAALRAGLDAPFSCQEGVCGTCRAKLEEGKTFTDRCEALSPEEISRGEVLTCRAKPLTKVSRIRYR